MARHIIIVIKSRLHTARLSSDAIQLELLRWTVASGPSRQSRAAAEAMLSPSWRDEIQYSLYEAS
jgi:hypothetical protein